jgi:hypothetical protein
MVNEGLLKNSRVQVQLRIKHRTQEDATRRLLREVENVTTEEDHKKKKTQLQLFAAS